MTKLGFVLFTEQVIGAKGQGDMVVWSEDTFFRIRSDINIKPLSAISFSTLYGPAPPVGKFNVPAFSAGPFKPVFEQAHATVPWVKGYFTRKGADCAVFNFNPCGLLEASARANFPGYKLNFVDLPFDKEVMAQFVVRCPRYSSEPPYPVIKAVRTQVGKALPLTEPTANASLRLSCRSSLRAPNSTLFVLWGSLRTPSSPPSVSRTIWM